MTGGEEVIDVNVSINWASLFFGAGFVFFVLSILALLGADVAIF